MKTKTVYTAVAMLIAVCFSSCKSGESRDRAIVIDLTEKQEIALSDIVDRIRAVPLIMPETDLLGNIKDVCVAGDTVYVLDDLTASLLAFDMNTGLLIKRICHRGNGPNEYVNPVAITFDADKLYLLDLPTKHIISYDRELNPMETISLTFPAWDFIATQDGFLLQNLARLETLNKVVRTDKKGTVLGSYLPFSNVNGDEEYMSGVGRRFVKTSGDKVLFSEAYSNKIFIFDEMGYDLSCSMDFIRYNPPPDVNYNPELMEQYAFCDIFFVWGDGYIMGVLKDSEHYYCFYNPSEGKQRAGKVRDEKDGLPFFPRWQFGGTLLGSCLYVDIGKPENINKYVNIPSFDKIKLDDEDILLLFYDMKPPSVTQLEKGAKH
jgi:hypothetical protein